MLALVSWVKCESNGLERNEDLIEQIIWTLEHQLRLQGDVQAVERFRQLIERELDAAEFHRRLREKELQAQELAADDLPF